MPRQTFCAREEVSCTRYSAEANGPCAKRQTGISSARPTGNVFCPRSGCLQAAGAVFRPCCSFASKGVGPKRIQGARLNNVEAQPSCLAPLHSGWRGACIDSLASSMTKLLASCSSCMTALLRPVLCLVDGCLFYDWFEAESRSTAEPAPERYRGGPTFSRRRRATV